MPSTIEKAIYKLRGAKNWPWTDATVFNSEAVAKGRGMYQSQVSYSFWLAGHIYSSVAYWTAASPEPVVTKGDVIQIQYNPASPDQSYYPAFENPTAAFYGMVAFGIFCLCLLTFAVRSMLR